MSDLNKVDSWKNCHHRFIQSFGPVLTCVHCGATTMIAADPKESKKIHAPSNITQSFLEKDTKIAEGNDYYEGN